MLTPCAPPDSRPQGLPATSRAAIPIGSLSLHARMFYSFYRIRRVEEEIARVYPGDQIKSPVHLSIGQEAVAVGVCEALQPQDIVFGTYRGHAAYLAKGGDLPRMIAELYGKATGCAKGKGGSMHLVDVSHGVMGSSAVVATTIPNAVGYAYALQSLNQGRVVVSFFGDGATDEGVFYESLNFAALKSLPILFVCENNGYAIHTPVTRRQKLMNLCERARQFGVPAEQVPDNDTLRIFQAAHSATAAMRSGHHGPHFLECLTYRWKEHVGPNEDYQLGYRSRAEAEPWLENDQLIRLAALIPLKEKERIEAAVEAEIKTAFAFAEQSPFPELSDLFRGNFKES